MIIDWEHIYILGYEDAAGKSYLTSWIGDAPIIDVVVTGTTHNMPFWKAPIPSGAKIHRIPDGIDGREYAQTLGGVLAFGWYCAEALVRAKPHANSKLL